MLSERSYKHKRPHTVWFHLYQISGIGKPIETEIRLMVAKGWQEGDGGKWLLNEYWFALGGENTQNKIAFIAQQFECNCQLNDTELYTKNVRW